MPAFAGMTVAGLGDLERVVYCLFCFKKKGAFFFIRL